MNFYSKAQFLLQCQQKGVLDQIDYPVHRERIGVKVAQPRREITKSSRAIFVKHLHESISALLHLFVSSNVPDNICHRYHVVLGEEEEVQQEENDCGGDESQKVDVDPHAESLSAEEVKSDRMLSFFRTSRII